MNVKVYRIKGTMRIKDTWQKFTIEVTATKPSEAIEKVYSNLGSRHKLPRNLIRIESIKEIPIEEIKRRDVMQLVKLDKIVIL